MLYISAWRGRDRWVHTHGLYNSTCTAVPGYALAYSCSSYRSTATSANMAQGGPLQGVRSDFLSSIFLSPIWTAVDAHRGKIYSKGLVSRQDSVYNDAMQEHMHSTKNTWWRGVPTPPHHALAGELACGDHRHATLRLISCV